MAPQILQRKTAKFAECSLEPGRTLRDWRRDYKVENLETLPKGSLVLVYPKCLVLMINAEIY